MKAPDLELNVLVGIEDVTDQVNRDVTKTLDDGQAAQARRRAMAQIEKEATDKNGLQRCRHPLSRGQYHLYSYKKYTDVRLCLRAEFDIAFFGGDPTTSIPRYDLDICFFRAYEDGKPAKVEHFLKWSPTDRRKGN